MEQKVNVHGERGQTGNVIIKLHTMAKFLYVMKLILYMCVASIATDAILL